MTDLKYRAALIDRCIEVVRISELRRNVSTDQYYTGMNVGAERQIATTIAALELFKAGPKEEEPT